MVWVKPWREQLELQMCLRLQNVLCFACKMKWNGLTNKTKEQRNNTLNCNGAIQKNTCIHGHRTLKAPHPVRSAQLTRVPPSQYHGGGPRGNPGCCGFSSSFFFFFCFFLVVRSPSSKLEKLTNYKLRKNDCSQFRLYWPFLPIGGQINFLYSLSHLAGIGHGRTSQSGFPTLREEKKEKRKAI
jgi:hypothetical protein